MDVVNSTVDLVSTIEIETEKPAWYSPDPQYVSDYMNDIMHCYRQSEGSGLPKHGYLSAHTDINEKMREILVDWLVEVHMKFNLQAAVLYTTVQLIDRFLGMQAVTRSKLQLVGITAMLISSKMEEIYPPEVKDFVYISDKAYTQEEIIQMEQTMLNTLKFKIAFPTVYMFSQQIKIATQCDEQTSRVASFLMDMTLQDYSTLKYSPSLMAAACVNLAERMQRNLSFEEKIWTTAQEQWVGYAEFELRECMQVVNEILSCPRELRAVRKKYTSSKYGKVAQIVQPLASENPEMDQESPKMEQ
jgi:cyclin B